MKLRVKEFRSQEPFRKYKDKPVLSVVVGSGNLVKLEFSRQI